MTAINAAATAAVVLRPSTDADRDFLVRVYGSTRADELAQVPWTPDQRDAFVLMQFLAQDRDYRGRNPHGSFDVIEVGGKPAGRLVVDRQAAEIRIVDISLLPELRGAGVGGRLIAGLINEASATGRVLSLHVGVRERAAALYGRLGFAVVAEQGVRRRMEWRG